MSNPISKGNQLSAEKFEFINDQRIEIARMASCDIEGLSRLIMQMGLDIGDEDICAVRSMVVRINQLSCLVLSAVDDSLADVVQLSRELTGSF